MNRISKSAILYLHLYYCFLPFSLLLLMEEIMSVMGNKNFLYYIYLNRVGPLLAVLDVQKNGEISDEVEIPYWGLAFGGGSFIAGIMSVQNIFLF